MKKLINIILAAVIATTIASAQQFDLISVNSENKIAQSPFFTISNNAMNLYANSNFSSPFAVATDDTFLVERPSSTTSVGGNNSGVKNFHLEQNYPNPFNPSTSIRYTVPSVTLNEVEGSRVSLKVYDVLGNEVATLVNEEKPAGSYEVKFDAAGLSSGIYFYKLQAGSLVETKKMILMK